MRPCRSCRRCARTPSSSSMAVSTTRCGSGLPRPRPSRSATPTKASRPPNGPSCVWRTTTRLCTSARGCTTASPRGSRGSCPAAIRKPRPTGSGSTSIRTTTISPARSSASAPRACKGTRPSTTTRRRTTRGTRCGNRRVTIDEGGWTVEMRIPFSQLRFTASEHHTFGINALRYIQRKNERAWLVHVPKTESGLASRMGHLEGLDGVSPHRTLELLPYVSSRAEYVAPATAGDPFNDGTRLFGSAGLDLKYRPTQQPHARRHDQPRLRPGRGRSGRRQPHGLRDVLRGEAPVLHRRGEHLQQLRPRRGEQLLGVQPIGADHLLFAANRAVAAGGRRWRLRRSPGPDDDSRRRQAHRQDQERLERRPARGRHRARAARRRSSADSRIGSRSSR